MRNPREMLAAVYPQGYQGERQQPAFNGLLGAFNLGALERGRPLPVYGPRKEE